MTSRISFKHLLFSSSKGLPTEVTLLSLQPWIHRGFTVEALPRVAEAMGVRDVAMAPYLGVSGRTLQRAMQKSTLSVELSDRLAALANILVLAQDVLGSIEEARRWLSTSQVALDGKTPDELLRTVTGCREVELLLGRIQHGVYT